MQWVLNAVECQLLTTVGTRFNTIKEQLWKTVDEAITLQDCVIYRWDCVIYRWVCLLHCVIYRWVCLLHCVIHRWVCVIYRWVCLLHCSPHSSGSSSSCTRTCLFDVTESCLAVKSNNLFDSPWWTRPGWTSIREKHSLTSCLSGYDSVSLINFLCLLWSVALSSFSCWVWRLIHTGCHCAVWHEPLYWMWTLSVFNVSAYCVASE